MHQKIIFFSLIILLFGFILYSLILHQPTLTIYGDNISHTYTIEIAETPQMLRKGLMYRKNMPQDHGMLFKFKSKQTISMWMKNTYIPLDMLFINENKRIVYIYQNARPFDESIITSPIRVQYVLELNAGQVKQNNIQIGQQLQFP